MIALPAACANLRRLVDAQLGVFPTHEAYLTKRLLTADGEDMTFAEELAGKISVIVGGDLEQFCRDYRWLAETVLEEELFFRRENRYRLSTFAEAEATIYGDRVYMTRYMNGLLLSQLWWSNHTAVLRYFRDRFLPANPLCADHLEVGPGHGLFLYYAALSSKEGSVAAWDVSQASVDQVKATFRALGMARPVTLDLVNLFDAPAAQFDSVTFSEVLEHLEEPDSAMTAIRKLLKPGGRAFINAPVNSPAPDHITLFRTPEEVVDVVRRSGCEIEDVFLAPTTGATLERARKLALAISTVVVARAPA